MRFKEFLNESEKDSDFEIEVHKGVIYINDREEFNPKKFVKKTNIKKLCQRFNEYSYAAKYDNVVNFANNSVEIDSEFFDTEADSLSHDDFSKVAIKTLENLINSAENKESLCDILYYFADKDYYDSI